MLKLSQKISFRFTNDRSITNASADNVITDATTTCIDDNKRRRTIGPQRKLCIILVPSACSTLTFASYKYQWRIADTVLRTY